MSDPRPATPGQDYHHGPWLTHSGSRFLLPPYCPAIYKWRRSHPRKDTDAFDFGKAVHRLVLGAGEEIAVCDYPDWRTKDARADRDAHRAAGRIPILAGDADYETAKAAADAVLNHPLGGILFSDGEPEHELHWTDPDTGVDLAARLDWLPHRDQGRRLVVPDLKTSLSADPRQFGKSAANFGYATQAAWYLDGLAACGIDDQAAFVFVVVAKEPPHPVSVIQLDGAAIEVGRMINRCAIAIYARCVADDRWPEYSTGIETVHLPSWYMNQEIEATQ